MQRLRGSYYVSAVDPDTVKQINALNSSTLKELKFSVIACELQADPRGKMTISWSVHGGACRALGPLDLTEEGNAFLSLLVLLKKHFLEPLLPSSV